MKSKKSVPAATAATAAAASAPIPAPAVPQDRSSVRRLWDVFRREPMLLVTCSYLFVSVVGLWDSYWFYRRFDIPILEYMQSSDYFVAGLRRPAYLLLLGWVLLASMAALWPMRWRERHPERAARIERRWWGRFMFPRRSDWWFYLGLHPETMTSLTAMATMAFVLFAQSGAQAEVVRKGGGNAVQVRTPGAPEGLLGDWRLLGTSNAFVFLWEPGTQRAEVLPIEAIAGIRPLGRRPQRPAGPATTASPAEASP